MEAQSFKENVQRTIYIDAFFSQTSYDLQVNIELCHGRLGLNYLRHTFPRTHARTNHVHFKENYGVL